MFNITKKDKNVFKQMVILPVLSILCGIIISFVGLEVILNFFPVNEGLRLAALNDKQPFLHFTPNRTSTWSKGWNFSIVNKVHSNNCGFINNQDYDPKANNSLLAVIGDSYVEAVMVPYSETVQGRLAKFINNSGRVYSFGISGAGLSDYLNLTEYTYKVFKPNAIVFIIISNDFEKLLYNKKQGAEGHYYFFEDPETKELILDKVDYDPGFFKKLLRNSKLFMYLMTNVNIFEGIKQRFKTKESYISNIEKVKDEKTISDSKRVIDAFLKQLPKRSGLGVSKVLFIVDGIREVVYDSGKESETKNSYFDIIRRYFINKAVILGYEVIDMQKVFEEHYRIYKERFEYPTDGHWNGVGHTVAAEAISKSNVFKALFKQ